MIQFALLFISIFIVESLQLSQQLWNFLFWLIETQGEVGLFSCVNLDPQYIINISQHYKVNYTQVKMISRLSISFKFSLFTKMPRAVPPPEKPKSWLNQLFSKNQDSVTYVLLQQLFIYLQTTSIFKKQLPYLSNTERILQNNMIIHTYLLKERLTQQKDLPRSQMQKFTYNLQAKFFPDYASFVNPDIPTTKFRDHFSESYFKKLQIFSDMIHENEWKINPNKQLIKPEQYCPIFRKLVFENRVDSGHIQLIKYCQYYVAHRKYLFLLEWNDMVNYKIKWGFQSLKFLNQAINLKKPL